MKKNAQRIEKIILQNISNYNFSVEMLAGELNISTSHLYDTVNYFFSLSPHKLIESIKIQKALFMFNEGCSIKSVQKKLGYTNPRTIRRIFNKRLGLSPKDCRDKILNNNGHNCSVLKILLIRLWRT